MKSLTPSDKEFFSRVNQSAFLNPFSEKRHSSDAHAVGKKANNPFLHLGELLNKLDTRLQTISTSSTQSLYSLYTEEDAQLLEVAILFQVLHRHRDGLDAYIRNQVKASDKLLPADCASEIFSELCARGFSVDRAEAFVALIFQMRRAYYFISTGLMGQCDSMRSLREKLWNVIFTSDIKFYVRCFWNRLEDFSTLLLGETGTGKGAAAMALGRSNYIPYKSDLSTFSENFAKSFLSINLSEFSENLIESELFGHRKGAFTGATSDHEGIFSRCSRRGAIFLDEIGDVSEQVQIKLLRVLQERVFFPVGGHERIRFGGRVIAATNQDIEKLRNDGRFRNDFYYRLSSTRIELPSLRMRIAENEDELTLMLTEVVKRMSGEELPELVERIQGVLQRDLPKDYGWPGNVRELEQAVRSVILSGEYIGEKNANNPSVTSGELNRCLSGDMTLTELEKWYCRCLYDKLGTYGAVAAKLGIDWRTVKQKIES